MVKQLDWDSIGSILASVMILRAAIYEFLPPEVFEALHLLFSYIFQILSPAVSFRIDEYESYYDNNELYESVQHYLSSKCFSSAQSLKISKPMNSKQLTYTMETNQKIEDGFNGCRLKWSFYAVETENNVFLKRFYELSFHPKHKEMVQSSYIPHVINQGAINKFAKRERKLYRNRSLEEEEEEEEDDDDGGGFWSSVPFSHPSTFDTVAINPTLKTEIQNDLLNFVREKEFYAGVGRAWKRGYLLYGPPGTGKTSLIAAIANFLDFDIYDLELTAVSNNSELRKLLIETKSKSVIVVEDIDCMLDLSDRKKDDNEEEEEDKPHLKSRFCEVELDPWNSFEDNKNSISLSGVLNFADGLWSSCGEERLMIFTTNHKENLDAALLRPGRMDKHINLSWCEFPAFKILAKNYLYIEEHELMKEVEEMLPLVKMSPADIAEIFMSCYYDSDLGMRNVVQEIKRRLKLAQEEKEEEEEENESNLDESSTLN